MMRALFGTTTALATKTWIIDVKAKAPGLRIAAHRGLAFLPFYFFTFMKQQLLTILVALCALAGTPLEGATVKELLTTSNLAANGTLTLNFTDASSIEAGKPYIVKWETTGDNITAPVFTDVTISSTEPTAVEFTGGSFVLDFGDETTGVVSIHH